ncbi:efflux transporter outer membrane subunit [Chitinasiproducens palmae]|uniref:Efflux transporter, outer membrane factor (OMF) lipoprotein, NodT family n=1 Tax=Chitinasiproducens palmae TaxID=1770053 RepID=A0A1H2PX81_9BURK|nr:efflux transporter outer membrane subunit [Chitinasiproducens palmae]SDV51582.1 efflux transporter, outer membrane factor (OMF) lipoprotein, NodT family [Chitinasiproducens palmae]
MPTLTLRAAACAALLASLLAGCADPSGIAPRETPRPLTTLAPGAAIEAAARDAAWPATQWWQALGDPQLDALMTRALADSPTLSVANARVREAEALAENATASRGPTLNADVALNREHWPESTYYGGGTLAGTNTFNNTARLTLSYPLDFFGRQRNAAESALDAARAAALEARATQLSLSINLAQTYARLALQYALRDVASDSLADRRQVLALAQRRFAAGIGTQLEVSQAEAPLPQAELTVARADQSIALLRNQIAALLGAGPGAGDAIARPRLLERSGPDLPSALPAELAGHRPDIVAARWRIEAQLHDVKSARAAFYPNINLVATGGGMAVSDSFWTFTRLSSFGFTAGPAISLPIFDSGRLRAQLGTASARADVAVGQYNDAVVRALREIADQTVTWRALDRQRAIAERALATAQRSHDIAQTAFRRGLTDYLNVLNAEEQLFTQRQAIAELRVSRVSAWIGLAGALGGGLATPADLPEAAHDARGDGTPSAAAVTAAAASTR